MDPLTFGDVFVIHSTATLLPIHMFISHVFSDFTGLKLCRGISHNDTNPATKGNTNVGLYQGPVISVFHPVMTRSNVSSLCDSDKIRYVSTDLICQIPF